MDVVKKFDAGVLHVSLNNSGQNNALTPEMIIHLADIFQAVSKVEGARVIVLSGTGDTFCAGCAPQKAESKTVDLNEWIKKKDQLLSGLLKSMISCPLPIIAIGHGNNYGAGIGLIAAADISFSEIGATFCLIEPDQSPIPESIVPYLVSRIGATETKRYLLTGEVFQASEAKDMGLVNFADTELKNSEALDRMLSNFRKESAGVSTYAKGLVRRYCFNFIDL